jgi:hypothetical protein
MLARERIKNTFLQEEASNGPQRSPRNVLVEEHGVYQLPVEKKFLGAEVVDVASKSAQQLCISCRKKTRTCCKCTKRLY